MTLSATNFLVRQYLKTRQRRIHKFMQEPHVCQEMVFKEIIKTQSSTQWGTNYNYKNIKDQKTYSQQIPVQGYELISPHIEKMIEGAENILAPTEVRTFAKSSGTSNSASKYIPVTDTMLKLCHDTASWDLLSVLYNQRPETKIFTNKNLIMAGSVHHFEPHRDAIYGDISAITLNNLPPFSRPYYTPDFETALLDDWDQKLTAMVETCSQENVAMIAGVPSWTLILFKQMMDYNDVSTMEELWPEASIYIHGGVGFGPYQKAFDAMFPSGSLDYLEVYNASEGFFAFQNNFEEDDLLLLLDHGIYYEFIPKEEIGKEKPETIGLKDVELGKTYALVISTLSGLSRYRLGDTVKFTSHSPYKIKVVGREQQYINVFGEELMVFNAEQAITKVANEFDVKVIDYTVAPLFIGARNKGTHQWLIEFENEPADIKTFEKYLDQEVQKTNEDYVAKRSNNLVLENLKITSLPRGTFHRWLENRGKLGGQNKIPRLSNDRKFAEEIISLIQN